MNNSIIPFYKQIDKLIVKSKGCYLYDSDGKHYIDFESGDWAANIGHSNERISQVIKDQVNKIIHDGLRFRNKPSEELAIKLMTKFPVVEGKCVFLNSGSESVNLGLTLACNLSKRKKILKIDCSFLSSFGHGLISADNTNLIEIPINDLESVSKINFTDIAVFVLEPGNSKGLIQYPTNEFVTAVALKVKQNGGFLMANDVTTGFGRTGKWFGFQHYDFQPDIISTGKGLGNGYPISCLTISKEVADMFDKSPFRYAQSHQNDPLGCAVGMEVINIIESENLITYCSETGKYFELQLQQLQKVFPDKIKEIRARGLMIAMELEQQINTENLYLQLINMGFLVGHKENVLRFMPPLIIEKAHIDDLISALGTLLPKY
jgi:acetylornithine/N-succinyldiaminopimelate aminotransferase